MTRRSPLARLALIVLLVGACAVTTPPSPPVASSSPSSASLPTDEMPPSELPPASTPRDSPLPAGWQRVGLAEVAPVNVLTDILAVDGGFVAIGIAGDAAHDPIALHSSDGVTWTSEPISSGFGGTPAALARLGDRVLAVGGAETGRCAHPFAIDFWVRASGGWTEAPWDDRLCAGYAGATLLDQRGTAILVGVGSGGQPLVWSSADGLTWRDLAPSLGDFLPTTAVTAGDRVLLFGLGPAGRPALLTSADGRRFTTAPFPVLADTARPLQAFVRGDEVLVFLSDGPALGLARRDAAGEWSVEPAPGVPGDQVTRIRDVAGTFIALGATDAGSSVAWTSPDGTTWAPLDLPAAAAFGVVGVARVGPSIVLVGSSESADGTARVGTIWTGPAPVGP